MLDIMYLLKLHSYKKMYYKKGALKCCEVLFRRSWKRLYQLIQAYTSSYQLIPATTQTTAQTTQTTTISTTRLAQQNQLQLRSSKKQH